MGNALPCLKGDSYSPGNPKGSKGGSSDVTDAMPNEGRKGRKSYSLSTISTEPSYAAGLSNGKLVINAEELHLGPGEEFIDTRLAYTPTDDKPPKNFPPGEDQEDEVKEVNQNLVDGFFSEHPAEPEVLGLDNPGFDEATLDENTTDVVVEPGVASVEEVTLAEDNGSHLDSTHELDTSPSDCASNAKYFVDESNVTVVHRQSPIIIESDYEVADSQVNISLPVRDEEEECFAVSYEENTHQLPSPVASPEATSSNPSWPSPPPSVDLVIDDNTTSSTSGPIIDLPDRNELTSHELSVDSELELPPLSHAGQGHAELDLPPSSIEGQGHAEPVLLSSSVVEVQANVSLLESSVVGHSQAEFESEYDLASAPEGQGQGMANDIPPPPDFGLTHDEPSYSADREFAELTLEIETIQDHICSTLLDSHHANDEEFGPDKDKDVYRSILNDLNTITSMRDLALTSKGQGHEEMYLMDELSLPQEYALDDSISNEEDLSVWYMMTTAKLNQRTAKKLQTTQNDSGSVPELLKEHLAQHDKIHQVRQVTAVHLSRGTYPRNTKVLETVTENGIKDEEDGSSEEEDQRDRYEIMGRYNQIMRDQGSDEESGNKVSRSTSSSSSSSSDDSSQGSNIEVDAEFIETVKEFIKSESRDRNSVMLNHEAVNHGIERSDASTEMGESIRQDSHSIGVGISCDVSDVAVDTDMADFDSFQKEMETRDQEVLAKLDTIIDGDEPDDEVISKLLQTHMETTGALSRYHDQELSRHQAAVMAKLKQRMKAMENNNLDEENGVSDAETSQQDLREFSEESKQLDELYQQRMESEEDLQGVAQVLEEHRRQHVSLLQQRQREREVMTAKLKERIERLPKRDTNLEDSSARIPDNSHFSQEFYAELHSLQERGDLNDQDIIALVKQHLSKVKQPTESNTSRKKRHRKSKGKLDEQSIQELLKMEQEQLDKLREMRQAEKAKTDQKLQEKLQERTKKPQSTDIPEVPPPRKTRTKAPRQQTMYENVDISPHQ